MGDMQFNGTPEEWDALVKKNRQTTMAQQTDIEIKNVALNEVAIPTRITLYMCVYWHSNGVMFTNTPTEDKRQQEDYALSMSLYAAHTCIYKFEIDVPNFKNK